MSNTERFKRLFRGRENCYGQYIAGPEGEKVEAWTKGGAAPPEAWDRHLRGGMPFLGICPLTQDNLCYFGAIDVDEHGVDLEELERKVKAADLPLVVCRSKSGGAHLYLFLRDPAPGKTVHEKLQQWKAALGCTHNPDGRDVEVFPKQVRLKASDEKQGNWLNLAYWKADDSPRFALKDGHPLGFEDFLDHAEATAVSWLELESITPAATGSGLHPALQEGPPCMVTLHQLGYPRGSRNQGLFNAGVLFKLADEGSWREVLREYASGHPFDPPLPPSEVDDVIKSLERREYAYLCNQLPIQPHCQKSECKKRRLGIGAFRAKKIAANFPGLTRLRKIMTDPPRWHVDVDDEPIELTTDDLLSMVRFRKAVLEQQSKMVPMLKQGEWDDMVRELLADHEVVQAPEDAGVLGQFITHVRSFMERRKHGEHTREDLLLGRPYEEGGRVYFRSSDLAAYLQKQNFREYTFAKMYTALRQMGAGDHEFKIDGMCVRCWWVPSPSPGQEQTEDFSPPGDKRPSF